MADENATKLVVVTKIDNDGFHLNGREKRLIANFRAMKTSAQDMLVDLSDQYKRTLPAVPVRLQLLRSAENV